MRGMLEGIRVYGGVGTQTVTFLLSDLTVIGSNAIILVTTTRMSAKSEGDGLWQSNTKITIRYWA